MGIAESSLVAVSNLCVQYTIFPMIFAMWFANRSLLRTAMSGVVFLFGYTLIVTFGANIGNPLNLYTGLDLDQAQLIFCTVYDCLAVGYAFMGAGWAYFLKMPELLPFGARPIPGLERTRRRMIRREGHRVYTPAGPKTQADTYNNFGIPGLVPSWQHYFVTIGFFLATVGAPQVLYTYFMNIVGDELMAWMLGMLLPLPLYLIYYLYCRFAGDPAVFGPSEYYLKADPDGLDYGLSARELEKEAQKTSFRVAMAIWPMAILHFLGVMVLGAVRFYTDDVDNNWLFAVGWWAALLIIALLLGAVTYFRRREDESNNRAAATKDDDDCDEDAYEGDGGGDSGDENSSGEEGSTMNANYGMTTVQHRRTVMNALANDH